MIEKWDGPRFTPTTISRDREAAIVAAELVARSGKRLVLLEGPPGSGKTMFTRLFADRYNDHFRSEIYFATDVWTITDVEGITIDDEGPSLLVLDDIDLNPGRNDWMTSYIDMLLANHQNLSILAVTREGAYSPMIYRVQMSGLDRAETLEFLQRYGMVYADSLSGLEEFSEGNPLVLSLLAGYSNRSGLTFSEILHALKPFRRPGLLGPDGRPIGAKDPARSQIITDIRSVNSTLLESVIKDPQMVYSISPRQFEEISAEIFTRLGYEVTLTPTSGDGGADLHVAKRDDLGSFVYFVECKQYAPDRPIGVGLVRQLLGSIEMGQATAGLLLTTSSFTSGARDIERQKSYKLALRDYGDLKTMLDRIAPASI